MTERVYKSKVDWWLAVLICLPIVGGVAALIAGLASGQDSALFAGTLMLAVFGLILGGLVLPMRYTIGAEGLRVRAGLLLRLHVPWDKLVSVEKSSNPLSSPALSLQRLKVTYRKASGSETYVLISPTDRDAFTRDLEAARAEAGGT